MTYTEELQRKQRSQRKQEREEADFLYKVVGKIIADREDMPDLGPSWLATEALRHLDGGLIRKSNFQVYSPPLRHSYLNWSATLTLSRFAIPVDGRADRILKKTVRVRRPLMRFGAGGREGGAASDNVWADRGRRGRSGKRAPTPTASGFVACDEGATVRWTEQQFQDFQRRRGKPPAPIGHADPVLALGRLPAGAMNKTEALYAEHLRHEEQAGRVVWWKFKPSSSASRTRVSTNRISWCCRATESSKWSR
jgi:hypothetical protein